MQEGQLLMTQADRDRLVALRKAKKKLITQREAAAELGVSVRQVKRLLQGWKKRGDKVVVHGLRGPAVEAADRGGRRERGGEDSVGGCISRVRSDFGSRILAKEAPHRGEQGDGAEMDEGGPSMAGQARAGERGAPVAAAAKPPGGAGAVGHQRARLAGRPGREAVPDRHDGRRHQPVVGAVRAARFDPREPEAAGELPGEVRTAGGVLYGQSESVSDGGETQAG